MSRYSIAEWYGHPFLTLSPTERQALSLSALQQAEPPDCPFANKPCNKRGGVCALRKYAPNGPYLGQPEGDPVIVCPVRFQQGAIIPHWLADIVGFSGQIHIAREVPFMVSAATGRPAGRIDIVIAQTADDLVWFGLEVQAVYFSGTGMEVEFKTLQTHDDVRPPYPSAVRRPDWRSSSAKRLMPQLQIKGPTLRRWGSKIAVTVDRPFFQEMGGPSTVPSHDLGDGDVIWMVPKLVDGILQRGHWEVLTLEASAEKLLSAHTIRRQAFEKALQTKLRPLL